MGRKHMLMAMSAFIGCFLFAAVAADIVFGGVQEALQAQDSIIMALDLDDGTDLLEQRYEALDMLVHNENVLHIEAYSNDSEEDNSGNDSRNYNDEMLAAEVLLEPSEESDTAPARSGASASTFDITSDIILFSIDDSAAGGDIPVDAVSYEADLLQNIQEKINSKKIIEYDKVIAYVSESLNIRKDPSTDSEVIGRLYKDGYGIILERGEEWTKISSGNVIGYAHNDYLLFDNDAMEFITEQAAMVVEVSAGGVNIRSMPSTEGDVVGTASKGDIFPSDGLLDEEEWNAVDYNGATAYIHKDLTEVKLNLSTAKTIEEIKKKEREEKIEKALASAKNVQVSGTNRKAVTVSDEDIYLMATVIASEALSESYQGKLAVANVIINRLLKGNWGSTISAVVYAPGQFSGSNTGRFEKFEKLITEDCKKAAIEALAGVNNIDDFLYFISLGKANYSNYSKYYILGGHCFYMR